MNNVKINVKINAKVKAEAKMKSLWIIGILLLSGIIFLGEWNSCKEKKARTIMSCITFGTMILAITLIFQPNLPGPTQVVKLTFGWVDKLMK